jgi:hypothetical protein
MSDVSGDRLRVIPASIVGNGLPDSRNSSGEVVIVCWTAVEDSAALATSA